MPGMCQLRACMQAHPSLTKPTQVSWSGIPAPTNADGIALYVNAPGTLVNGLSPLRWQWANQSPGYALPGGGYSSSGSLMFAPRSLVSLIMSELRFTSSWQWAQQIAGRCAAKLPAVRTCTCTSDRRARLVVWRRSFQVINQRYDIVFYYFSNVTTVPGSKGQVGWCACSLRFRPPQAWLLAGCPCKKWLRNWNASTTTVHRNDGAHTMYMSIMKRAYFAGRSGREI